MCFGVVEEGGCKGCPICTSSFFFEIGVGLTSVKMSGEGLAAEEYRKGIFRDQIVKLFLALY